MVFGIVLIILGLLGFRNGFALWVQKDSSKTDTHDSMTHPPRTRSRALYWRNAKSSHAYASK